MPQVLVVIRHIAMRRHYLVGEVRAGVNPLLQKVIANTLSCDEAGGLTADDVSISWVECPSAELCRDIEMVVTAHDYASRQAYIDSRRAQIENGFAEAMAELRRQKPRVHEEHGLTFGQGRCRVSLCLQPISTGEVQI